ncbi:hypothetical protein BJX63DRAFT_438086 [Aspergillus granulosus]|uniref:Uncharacterized protein n=1 Tax=Aspergillus granulosus TaxID=176169 RepID=A0ABR4GT21_9EURO
MRVVAVFAALLAVVSAAPALEKRQQGENCRGIHFPDTCASHNLVQCDSSGSFLVCCAASIKTTAMAEAGQMRADMNDALCTAGGGSI